jgi:hypothetical protein
MKNDKGIQTSSLSGRCAPYSEGRGVTTSIVPTPTTPSATKGTNIKDEAETHWFALRTTYGREKKAYDYMTEQGCEAFLPTIEVTKQIDGHIQKVTESRIPNMFFAKGTQEYIESFVYDNVHLPYLRFYYRYFTRNNTKQKEPMIVPQREMEALSIICQSNEDDILLLQENVDKFTKGDMVRVVEGPFKGVEGIVARYKGQQRVGIVINGLLTATTTYIPSGFLKPIEDAAPHL